MGAIFPEDDSIVYGKAKKFAVRILRLCNYLFTEKGERVVSYQLKKSGTSIGANIAEGLHGMSKRDFYAKLSISLKEAHETLYWLEILHDAEVLSDREFQVISTDCRELIALLTAILKTTAHNINETP